MTGDVIEFKKKGGGEGEAEAWTPARALQEVLDDIESGKINPKAVAICCVVGDAEILFSGCVDSVVDAIGILEATKLSLVLESRD